MSSKVVLEFTDSRQGHFGKVWKTTTQGLPFTECMFEMNTMMKSDDKHMIFNYHLFKVCFSFDAVARLGVFMFPGDRIIWK